MSINFSTLKGLTIPEGNVTKITDASGRVLWSAVKPATIFLAYKRNGGGSFRNYANVTIDGISYPLDENDLTTTVLTVPIGTVITCRSGNTTLNGTTVASGYIEYIYTVVGDATIEANVTFSYNPMTGGSTSGSISIKEVTEDNVVVAITDTGSTGYCYVSVNGTKYDRDRFLYVPIGTQVTCFVKWDEEGDGPAYIFLNGSEILRDTSGNGVSYNHTANGNILIELDYKYSSTAATTCTIFITEL